ncbi:MAG: hypothetical protein NTW55_00210 [Planctomycetota bacterium]|nr:hypothetical protein [Planctomycetota bacterium]
MELSKTLCYMSFLVIAAFLMPTFAETPIGQLDSFDNINIVDANWGDTRSTGRMLQSPPGEVNEGTGSMKINFQPGMPPAHYDIEVVRTFNPILDFNDYKNLAITLWVWSDDVNDSRLREIVLHDSSANDHVGRFSVPTLKNIGWNKVIAPLRNFSWTENTYFKLHPNVVLWNQITQIGLWTACNPKPGNPIYMDDLRLEVAPDAPAMPYQMASFDDINDEDWRDDRGTGLVRQQKVADGNVNEGTGSMRIAFTQRTSSNYDIEPVMALIPALDFTARKDWAITVWVRSDLVNTDVNSSRLSTKLHEIILNDPAGHKGRYRVPVPEITGWTKVTANLMEFIWEDEYQTIISPNDVCLDAIVSIGLWTTCYGVTGNDFNDIYMDDLWVEEAADALSKAKIVNADRTFSPIKVDGNAADWAALNDSDVVDFDLASLPRHPCGNLHVKYRLAWDPNYLYILMQEQPGDGLAVEATSAADFRTVGRDTWHDNLALYFDFTNNRQPGLDVHISLWLYLGLSSTGRTDLTMAWTNGRWGSLLAHDPVAVANGSVATSGTLGSRIIEAKIKWSDLDNAINQWRLPEGGLAAAVKPGYIFGCDPRLNDREELAGYEPWTAEKGMAWFNGNLWEYRPSGRDIYSTDVRLVCSAADLNGDCDVNFKDYAQLAEKWFNADCNNLNGFCNGADIVIDGMVNKIDLAKLAQEWLSE